MDTTDPRYPPPGSFAERRQRFTAASLSAFHAYANWLVSISWRRFLVLSLLLLMCAGILQNIPPFSWRFYEDVPARSHSSRRVEIPAVPRPPATPSSKSSPLDFDVHIDDHGVRIGPSSHAASAAGAASGAGAESASSPEAASDAGSGSSIPSIEIKLPRNADTDEVKRAVEEARQSIREAIAEATQAANDAREAIADAADAEADPDGIGRPTRRLGKPIGDSLPTLAFFFIVVSAIVKTNYKGRLVAEVKAAHATEVAEEESLRRQVVEARMAAMQAQVEPHFLFNTLASIDHLIETDPPRASVMQKNLIALLRASMPTMREANAQGTRDLGREIAVIRPYIEILKVRMEERLQTEVRVSDGLMSAEFPPMMLQSLVENAIKHGLEPKPEGGKLTVTAEIVHGQLAITVADTGLGFGKAATAGTGIGLSNIRERLHLLYGSRARLDVAENPGGGTAVTITVPYITRAGSVPGAGQPV